jgi:ABC-type phosphate transport system substrate-binding protein
MKTRPSRYRVAILITIWAMLHSVEANVTFASDHLVVVVHPDNPVNAISIQDLRSMYLGETTKAGGREYRPVNFMSRDRIRDAFENLVLGTAPEKIAEHWKSRRFLGFAGNQPSVFRTPEAVKKFIGRGNTAIGYLPFSAVDASVRILPRVGDFNQRSTADGASPFVIE